MKKNISIVIATHRGIEPIHAILNNFNEDDIECINDIILVVDGGGGLDKNMLIDHKLNDLIKIITNNEHCGASVSRNIGTLHSKGEIILYLDSDIVPKPGIVAQHRSSYVNNVSSNIVGVAGVTRFFTKNNSTIDHSVKVCSLLFPFYQATKAKSLLWAPTSNISFKKSIIGNSPFSNKFSKAGGGEDIHICFKAIYKNGIIYSNPSAIANHVVWRGLSKVLKRFFRWGKGDSILLKVCKNEKIGVVKFREPTIGIFLILSFILSSIKAVYTNKIILCFLPIVFCLISLSTLSLTKYFRKKGEQFTIMDSYLSTLYVYIFDFGAVFGRLTSSFLNLFQMVELFPPEIDIYRKARWRSFYINIVLFGILILILIQA